MTSADLLTLIQAKYCPPHFLCFTELRDGTGFDSTRSADAVALGMFRSRGRDLYGFEIKVSRTDWLQELKRPEKAEAIAQYCDWWFLVVPDARIVQPGELPAPWGLMVPDRNGLKVVTKASRLDPKPLSRPLLCSLVKAAGDFVTKSVVQPSTEQHEKAVYEAYERGVEAGKRQVGHDRDAQQRLEQLVCEFQNASEFNLHDNRGPAKLGHAVNLVLRQEGLGERYRRELERQVSAIEQILASCRRELTELDDVSPALQRGA